MRIGLVYTESDRWAIGVRTLSAILKEAGYHTRLIIMGTDEASYDEYALKTVEHLLSDVDVIGISCFSRSSDQAIQVAKYIRRLGKFTVWGGIHAMLNPEECLEHVDMVCRGEGDEFILDVVRRLESGDDPYAVPNGAYKRGGDIIFNPMRPPLSDLDSLPLPDYSYADEFHLKNGAFIKPENTSDVTEPIMFIGSRGCANNCTYCSNVKIKNLYSGTGKYVRRMSVQRYVQHARSMRALFPKSKYYYFIDEDFFARSVKELKDFSEIFIREVNMPFECLASPAQITEEKMSVLVKAGLWRIRMGIESGSERTKREIYKRNQSNSAVLRAASHINKHPEVVPFYFLIISNPYEMRDDLIDSLRLMASLPSPYFLQVFNLVFFPGTALYERAVSDGLICGKEDSGYSLDFRGGLKYDGHAWKQKNLYLNGLLFLMEGKGSKRRLGILPRALLPSLLRPNMIEFSEKNTIFIRMLIKLKIQLLAFRKLGAKVLVKIIRNPRAIYDLKRYLSFNHSWRSRVSSPRQGSSVIRPTAE